MRTRKQLVVAALVGATVLGGAGVAMADVSTPDDLAQGGSALTALAEDLVAQFEDFTNGQRPEGADGTEVEPIGPDPRFVEGPISGLIGNGPLE
ncbi:MAG: hypothetical protein L0H64_24140 [Pseudonocardia sp.]|nr:hypothetical protein [Pseudonocardia sp.]